MSLKDKLSGVDRPHRKRSEPLWKGPVVDGITYSMLSRFLVCRERFRLYAVEGLAPSRTFDHKSGYGDMWHVCEEAHARYGGQARNPAWVGELGTHCSRLCQTYPHQQEQIDHWYNVCKVQFPLYIHYWSKHKDTVNRTPLLEEQVFDVPYGLPSGRSVRLRGKWDSVELVGRGKATSVWLQENKTKGTVDEQKLNRQLRFDLQTMLYLVALYQDTGITSLEDVKSWDGKEFTVPIKGVRYNVVRRPLSGGKGNIVRHKPSKSNPDGESKGEYYARVASYIKKEPQSYFMRWPVEVSGKDVETFRRQCLDPILEQLCDWYECVSWFHPWGNGSQKATGTNKHPVRHSLHYRHPFGVYNSLNEGGSTDLDEYLDSGSEVGLVRMDKLFTELEV